MSKSDKEMHDLYHNAYIKEIYKYLNEEENNPDLDMLSSLKRIVTYGVKATNLKHRINHSRQYITKELADSEFKFVDLLMSLMGELTPRQFISLFPIRKDFRGHKYEAKDYFYTRDYMDKFDQDKPLKGQVQVIELLWEYMNWEITDFNLALMDCMDNIRRLDGQESMMTEFLHENGVSMQTLYTDEKGKKFLVDDQTGKSVSVKSRPSYLKVKMGGKIN